MAKKKSESSAQGRQRKKNVKYMKDKELDLHDMPELTDDEIKRARRVGRPKTGTPNKQLIAIRLDPKLIEKLKTIAAKQNTPYQTLIHELLEDAADKVA